ncbi:MAG: hypothetical protein WDO13_05045 [Verrucomicrobiota bacterium]
MMISLGSACGWSWNFTPEPAMALVRAEIIARRHRVGEGEERRRRAALLAQPLAQQLHLVIEHVLQPRLTYVALALAVDRVRKRHVVGRDRLGQRARRATHAEEPARHFLPRADLGKGAVKPLVEVDLYGFLVRRDRRRVELLHNQLRGGGCGEDGQGSQIAPPTASRSYCRRKGIRL